MGSVNPKGSVNLNGNVNPTGSVNLKKEKENMGMPNFEKTSKINNFKNEIPLGVSFFVKNKFFYVRNFKINFIIMSYYIYFKYVKS